MHVNELVAQTRAVGAFHPEARTVIEIGGQDTKLLLLRLGRGGGADAPGGLRHERALRGGHRLASSTSRPSGSGSPSRTSSPRSPCSPPSPARIAGRCTVFAKTDMIHLQQMATPLPTSWSGLCLALARNFKSEIAKGKTFTPPIVFQGGVAANQAVVRAFERCSGLPPGELIVPEQHDVDGGPRRGPDRRR